MAISSPSQKVRRWHEVKGLVLNDESKTVNSAALKEEELGGDVERHELGQIRCAVRGEGGVQEHHETDTEKLEKSQKKAVRFLKRCPKGDVDDTGSDWANGPQRKSTSGGMMRMNRSLSTAQAEYCAVITEPVLGLSALVRVWTDTTSAKAIASRRRLWKTRVVELRYLCLQDMFKTGRVNMRRVLGKLNLADHLTKPWRKHDELSARCWRKNESDQAW